MYEIDTFGFYFLWSVFFLSFFGVMFAASWVHYKKWKDTKMNLWKYIWKKVILKSWRH